MVIACNVVGCNSEWNPVTTVTFHRITTNKKLLPLWLRVVDMKLTKCARICSLHFKPEDFTECSSGVRLKPDAVPSFNVLGNEVMISDDSFEDDEDNKDLSLLKKILMSNANRNNPAGEVDNDRDSSDDEQLKMFEAVIPCNSSHGKAKSPVPKEMQTIGIQVSRTTQGEIALRQQIKMLNMRLKRRDAKISYMKTVLNMIKKLVKGTDMEYKLSCELQNISKLSGKTGSNARKGTNTRLAKPGSPVSDCDDVIMNDDDEDFSPSEEESGTFCEVTLSSNLKPQNGVKL